jgi:hypothetical protein
MTSVEALATAALQRDSLRLRSLAQDLLTSEQTLEALPRPATDDPRLLVIAAAILELLASRVGQRAPAWTAEIGSLPEPLFLLEAAQRMPRLRELCEKESPEPLRKRHLYAPPDFLTFA